MARSLHIIYSNRLRKVPVGVLESLDLVPQSVACAARTMRLALAAAQDWKFTVRSTMVSISYASIAGDIGVSSRMAQISPLK